MCPNNSDAGKVKKSVIELTHKVQFHPEGSRTRLVVRREFRIRSSIRESVQLDLPPHSSVTRLRVRQAGVWREGALLESYEAFTGFEDALVSEVDKEASDGEESAPRAKQSRTHVVPVLVEQQHNAISFSVPNLKRKIASVTIEYELLAPSCYANDWHHVAYPISQNGPDQEVVFVRPRIKGVPALVSGKKMSKDSENFPQLACHNNAPNALVAKWPSKDASAVGNTLRLRASWKTMPMPKGVDSDLRFARIEIEAASKLSDAPKGAQFVFVLDASFSVNDPNLSNQLKIVRGLLHHVPDAMVQLVLMQRHARAVFEDFVPASSFVREIKKHRKTLVAANGSNMEEALNMGKKLLEGRQGPLRIVAIADGKWRSSYTESMGKTALEGLSDDTVFHWLSFEGPSSSDKFTVQDTDDSMHALAHNHGGQGFAIGGTPRGRIQVAKRMEQVARPMYVRKFGVVGLQDWASRESGRTIEGGVGLREMFADSALPDTVTLQGEVWSQPWEVTLRREKNSSQLGSLAIGNGIAEISLSDAQLATFSLATKTLSSSTSFLVRDRDGLYEPGPDAQHGGAIEGFG